MPKIFINYRRGADRHAAGRLYDVLCRHLRKRDVFMDVDKIPPGADFKKHLHDQVQKCNVFFALIGPDWVRAADQTGRIRLFQPKDFVRIEIEAALSHGLCMVPVLLDDTAMPQRQQLPPSIHALVDRHACWLRHDRFESDIIDLLNALPSSNRWLRSVATFFSRNSARPHLNPEVANLPAAVYVERKPMQRFFEEAIVQVDGSSLTATELYEAYCAWCEGKRIEPVALPTFGSEFGSLGVQKAKLGGRVRYIGISLYDPLRAF